MKNPYKIRVILKSNGYEHISKSRLKEYCQKIKKQRLAFAEAVNSTRINGSGYSSVGAELRDHISNLRDKLKNPISLFEYVIISRMIDGRVFESSYRISTNQNGVIGRQQALSCIRNQIVEYRQDRKRVYDSIYLRKPGSILKEFSEKILRRPKKPKDGAEYVGIEIECVTPQNADFSKLLPFSKYVDITGDGSIHYKENEQGTEFRVCLQRSEIREVLPKIMETIRGLGAKVNKSCGLHVHLDQRDNKSPEITFLRLVRSLGLLYTVVPSSRRSNNFCRRNRRTDWNIERLGTRYKAINSCAFNRHKTIEVRLFGGTLEETKIINWIETLYAIAEGETVLRCPRSFDTAKRYWKLSDENLAWLKERQQKFAELGNTINAESDSESNSISEQIHSWECGCGTINEGDICDECGATR